MRDDESIEREDRQLSEWLRANPGRERPTMTVSEFATMIRSMGHNDNTAHAWSQVCELVRSEDEDMVVIRNDDPEFKGILVVKDKEVESD